MPIAVENPIEKFASTYGAEHGGFRLCMACEPVVSARDNNQILYQECLVRLKTQDNRIRTAAEFVPQIEKRGLIAALDMAMLDRSTKELHSNPLVSLGLNVSLHTLVNQGSWDKLLRHIMSLNHEELTSKLVMEITENVPWQDVSLISDRVYILQSLGCRVALDDFGAGFTPLSAVSSIQFDIIKIDREVLKKRREPKTGISSLTSLIQFASCYCSDIVVEGIESEEEADIARDAGGNWLQGYLYTQTNKITHPMASV